MTGAVLENGRSPEIEIECAITNSRVVNFSEILAEPSIQALQNSNPLLYRTLEVFAYGTLKDLPEGVNLSPDALAKLRQLSLISLAASSVSNRQLSYGEKEGPRVFNPQNMRHRIQIRIQESTECVLAFAVTCGSQPMFSLGLKSVRELEDVVIDAIYNKLIKARLDSKGQFIEIDDWASRDAPVDIVPAIASTLKEFSQRVVEVRQSAQEDAERRDAQVVADRKRAQQAEAELLAARKALDESMQATVNSHEPSTSSRSKTSRSSRQRSSQATPTNK